ncbi:MAG: preprotein translocase subunit SecY [Ruminococcaceae bacterium]|nr:preprotein translocase subunit SecY [Oscillospiraceae bacterium]
MFSTIRNVWSVVDLRKKILFTVFILILYRLGAQIPLPYIDSNAIGVYFQQASGSIFGYLNMISGSALSRATLFALSISPYITSSIVMQLLGVAFPKLGEMAKEEGGKEKMTKYTRYLTVGLALLTAFGYYMFLRNQNLLLDGNEDVFTAIVIIICYCAGASLIMWLGEKINEYGIGNGISMILFANIVSGGFTSVGGLWTLFTTWGWQTALAVLGLVIALAMIWFMVFVSDSERRIPVQYAKRVVGRKMYGGQSSNLPMKINMSGVMPIIFASSIVSLPATIAMMAGQTSAETAKGAWKVILTLFGTDSFVYLVLYILLLFLFAYFYIGITFDPIEVSNNLKKNGGFVPGIRPGRPTSDYIRKILNRVTLIGATFLSIISGVPLLVNCIASLFDVTALNSIAFGGSSLLIVIGICLETAREIEAQMTMRNFKGFLD